MTETVRGWTPVLDFLSVSNGIGGWVPMKLRSVCDGVSGQKSGGCWKFSVVHSFYLFLLFSNLHGVCLEGYLQCLAV